MFRDLVLGIYSFGVESIFVGQLAEIMSGPERAFDEMRLIKEAG